VGGEADAEDLAAADCEGPEVVAAEAGFASVVEEDVEEGAEDPDGTCELPGGVLPEPDAVEAVAGEGVPLEGFALPADGEEVAPLAGFAEELAPAEDADGAAAADEAEELPDDPEDAEAVFAAPTSFACRSMVTGLRPAPVAAAALVSVAGFGLPAFGSAVFEAVLLGSGFLLSAAMNGLSLGSFTGPVLGTRPV